MFKELSGFAPLKFGVVGAFGGLIWVWFEV